jgi:NADH dehydrogenase FAD-containing subunit
MNSKVELIEQARNTVVLASGAGVHYDYLHIALEAAKGYDAITGFRRYAIRSVMVSKRRDSGRLC